MEALAIVSAVGAVVSALNNGIGLYKKWKAKKAKKASEEAATEQALVQNPPAVQKQYQFGEVTLGERFRRGDGKPQE